MGNFNKKFIVVEAENILNQCNEELTKSKQHIMISELKKTNKKLKKKNTFWKVSTSILAVIMFAIII